MKYALCLDDDGRIQSVTYDKYAPPDQPMVDALPEGIPYDYRYIDGEFIYDPLPAPDPVEPVPTTEERLSALETENAQLKEALDLLLSGTTEEEVTTDA